MPPLFGGILARNSSDRRGAHDEVRLEGGGEEAMAFGRGWEFSTRYWSLMALLSIGRDWSRASALRTITISLLHGHVSDRRGGAQDEVRLEGGGEEAMAFGRGWV